MEDACRGVDKDGIAAARASLLDLGALIVNSADVKPLVEATQRPIKLGLVAARNFKRKFIKMT